MNRYKVRLSDHASYIVTAKTAADARRSVWEKIKGEYTYGWQTKSDFVTNASTEKIS